MTKEQYRQVQEYVQDIELLNSIAELMEGTLNRIKELEKRMTKEETAGKPLEIEEFNKSEEQEPIIDRDCEHCSKTYGTLGCCDCVSNKWVYSCEEGHREYLLDQIRAEIETQGKWLAEAGYNAYNVSIAFESIKRALGKRGR